jgi:putative transposase
LRKDCTLSLMRKTYATDLSDEEWVRLKSHLPASKLPGKLRAHSLRDILDAIFYVLRSGCPWRMLPGDLPPWSTVYYHFRKLRLSGAWHLIFVALRAAERKRVGKEPDASAAIMDSQSVKTTEEGAATNGYDAHKNVKGRKRHLLVDTLGLALSVYVTPASACRTGRSSSVARRPQAAGGAPPEEDLGGRCLRRREAREVVRAAGRVGA